MNLTAYSNYNFPNYTLLVLAKDSLDADRKLGEYLRAHPDLIQEGWHLVLILGRLEEGIFSLNRNLQS